MAALADTTIIIDHLRGRREATELVRHESTAGEPLFASTLTGVELHAGARPSEVRRIDELMRLFIWIDVTAPIADRAGGYANRYGRSHRDIDVVDYVIAATCEELAVPLWTLNVRHFPMLPGLEAPY